MSAVTTLTTDAAFTAAETELTRLLALSPTTTDDTARDQLVDAWAVQWRAILDSTRAMSHKFNYGITCSQMAHVNNVRSRGFLAY